MIIEVKSSDDTIQPTSDAFLFKYLYSVDLVMFQHFPVIHSAAVSFCEIVPARIPPCVILTLFLLLV